MKSLKVKSCLIIVLALILISAVCVAFTKINFASADNVTINGSSVFYKAGDAEVKASGESDADDHYTMFVFKKDGDAVNYNRNNLAYKWFENAARKTVTEGEGANQVEVTVEDEANPTPRAGWFNMEIGFKSLDFQKFVITFESQQYVKNKDEKTTNYLVFIPSGTDKVKVAIGNDKDAEPKTDELAADNIKIAFSESSVGGNYTVTVTSGSVSVSGEFENIGGTFSKYSTSSTTPVTPLSFKAEFAEEEDAAKKACMVLYNLNGQSFLLTNATKGADDEYYGGGTIEDNVAPVLCLRQNVNYFNAGTEINTDFFTAIDVIKQSPSSTAAYFILDKNQVTAPSADFKPNDMSENGAFTVLKDGDGQRMILHENHYYPTTYDNNIYDDDFKPVGAVKIYFKLTDTSYKGTSSYVLLDWYVKESNLIKVNDTDYIAIADDKKGVSYTYTSGNSTDLAKTEWTTAYENYEKAVAKAAEGLKAGSKNYFYVPAAEGLFTDNSTAFADLSFTVYYMSDKSTNFSTTSGKASSLSIPLSGTGSEYVFTILASDAANNSMYYFDDKGEKQEIEASASNILDMWNNENNDQKYLPWFRFEVGPSEMTVEKPEEQDVAYKDKEYSFEFEINAVSGTYTPKYELFVFVNDRYLSTPFDENGNPDENGKGKSLSYEAFMEKKDWLFENHREWFDIILSTSEYEKGTAEEEKYGDYAWNGTSRFTPQQGNAFYLVKLTLTGNDQNEVTEYMGIASSIQVTPLKGEDTWLQDNMTSVILLCVAGAALIGIILLLVIKPKDKGDVDEKVFLPEKKSKTQKSKKQ